MREVSSILVVEHRLMELSCPPALLRRKIQELADHREDLKQEAMEEGVSETEAEERADALLGEPYALAENLAAALRQSSWWGRHPILGFCLLPPFGILLSVGLGLWLAAMISKIVLTSDQVNILADDSAGLAFFRNCLQGTYYSAIVMASALFCWLAHQTMAGLKWALAACAVCALHGWFFWVQVWPHNLSAGYAFPPHNHWVPALVPLVVVMASWLSRRGWSLSLQTATAIKPTRRSGTKAPRLKLPRTGLLTPTNLIVTTLFLGIGIMSYSGWRSGLKEAAKTREIHSKIWPAERAATMEHLATRQSVKETTGETTIDLKPHINVALEDSFGGQPEVKGNTLAELPAGVHIFGGVPFDVEGRIQLWGHGLDNSGKIFPERVRNITVARKCNRIHLLHSGAFVGEELGGTTVARLLLHYLDGSHAEIPINAGEHLLDWWGPIHSTEASANSRDPIAPGSELAWAGKNPWIQKMAPQGFLRIYKSTFDNPHPDREISSVEYASTMTQAAPFMVGMTVE